MSEKFLSKDEWNALLNSDPGLKDYYSQTVKRERAYLLYGCALSSIDLLKYLSLQEVDRSIELNLWNTREFFRTVDGNLETCRRRFEEGEEREYEQLLQKLDSVQSLLKVELSKIAQRGYEELRPLLR